MDCFHQRQRASFLLYRRILQCTNSHELEAQRQAWDVLNRPKYKSYKWSPEQWEAIKRVKEGLLIDDEEQRVKSFRWLYIKGPPGSGKSAVLLEIAVWAAGQGIAVLIVCPTGFLVYQYKAKLPDVPGAENIHVDTIQGVLKYKRGGSDSNVRWTPPSILKRFPVMLFDEGSQYEDLEWNRTYTGVRELAHSPMCIVVADFQQLQPVNEGGSCQKFCESMQCVELKTVYRTADNAHLLFQNLIREDQPEKVQVEDYFEERHWKDEELSDCVQKGLGIQQQEQQPFSWITYTNRGASEVSKAAVGLCGLTEAHLEQGYPCDPATKSELSIVAKPGITIRLSRNFDKQRGFVNGALATVCESLFENSIFTARLVASGNMVLVHPISEKGSRFLPCCYGYATTVRRAQGADLYHGCIWFDQHKYHAPRGYGYVAVSRFKSRAGCYLYGKLRRTDFLPVGMQRDDEQVERGYESATTDSEDEGYRRVYEDGDSDYEETITSAFNTGIVTTDFQ